MLRKKKQRWSAYWFFDMVLEAVSNQYNDNSLDEPTPANEKAHKEKQTPGSGSRNSSEVDES